MKLSTDARLIRLLKRSRTRYVSGEELSRDLKISRSAVWKYMEGLRLAGFEIQGVPHQGYRYVASPPELLADEITSTLQTSLIGSRVVSFKTLDSTNRLAREMGEKGSPEGTVIFAEEQHRGKGRLGRHWASPKGKGLYFSIILRPRMEVEMLPKLTLMAAVSIIEAIRDQASAPIGIRWPNDIVIDHRKLGGILTEMSAESDRLLFVVVGIGLNVHKSPRSLPQGGVSLQEVTGVPWDRLALACEILKRFETHYLRVRKGEDEALAREWERFSSLSGRRVEATTIHDTIRGTALGIDAKGALWIREDSGLQKRLVSADLTLLR